jgi:hypothetical protein
MDEQVIPVVSLFWLINDHWHNFGRIYGRYLFGSIGRAYTLFGKEASLVLAGGLYWRHMYGHQHTLGSRQSVYI